MYVNNILERPEVLRMKCIGGREFQAEKKAGQRPRGQKELNMLREQTDGWCWQEPNRMEGEEGRGWAVGSLTDHGTKLQFYSKATGSLWRVISWRVP